MPRPFDVSGGELVSGLRIGAGSPTMLAPHLHQCPLQDGLARRAS